MKNIIELNEAETAEALRLYFARTRSVNAAVIQVRLDVGMVDSGYGPNEASRPGFIKAVITLPDTELKE